MKIAVCVKRVPDTATKIRIGGDQKSIDPADVQYIISPYDEFAIEEALVVKEKSGAESVTVVSVGPEATQQNLRQALAMGADEAILVRSDDALDPFQTARNLANALTDGGYDLVFFGRLSVDDQGGQVGPLTARLLGIPCITEIVEFSLEGSEAKVTREIEGAKEEVVVQLPAAFTAQKGLNEPRYASLKGIMAAKKKPIHDRAVDAVDARLNTTSLDLPPGRPPGKIVGEGVEAVAELVRLLREEAKAI